MKITKDEVLYVADLARLDLDDASIDKFAGQIGDILAYVDGVAEGNRAAKACIDIALHDLTGKLLGKSLCQLWNRPRGGPGRGHRRRRLFHCRKRIPLGVDNGFFGHERR